MKILPSKDMIIPTMIMVVATIIVINMVPQLSSITAKKA